MRAIRKRLGFARCRLWAGFDRALHDTRGGVVVLFAVALLPLIAAVGAAIDYSMLLRQKTLLQGAADEAALRAARELHLAQVGSSSSLISMAQTYANANLGGASPQLSNLGVNVALLDNNTAVKVAVSGTYTSRYFNFPIAISAQATARAAGYPMCALSLDPSSSGAIYARTQAQITAQSCAVQANSNASDAIYTQGNAQMTAGAICSVGGAKGNNFYPTPITDCPIMPDPLALRQAPPIGACVSTNEVVSGGTLALMPGNYCGGLHVTGGAIVTLTPGEFVMSNGPLTVDSGSTLITSGAGIYLTGAGAVLSFAADTTINMTAPTSGPLAGLLVFEDHLASSGQSHTIYSNNAPVLHGTIYLPVNELYVETNGDVSKASAFTIIVAQTLHVNRAANLWLNSNYQLSNVPVPNGLAPGVPHLTQ
jgi:Flp pilus assembly protein TadG